MSEAAASFAVLGVDLDDVGAAVARHWGLGPELQQMIHRIPRDQRVHAVQGDTDALCKTASAANEVVDAISLLQGPRVLRALDDIAQRYARALKISPRDLKDALKTAREMVKTGGVPVVRNPDREEERPAAVLPDLPAGADAPPKNAHSAKPVRPVA